MEKKVFLNNLLSLSKDEQREEIKRFLKENFYNLYLFLLKNNPKNDFSFCFFILCLLALFFIFKIVFLDFCFPFSTIYSILYIYYNRNTFEKNPSFFDFYSMFFPESSKKLFVICFFIVFDNIFIKQ